MPERVRILFAIDSLVRGGTELQLIGLIDRLDRDRYEPWLLTIRPTDQELVPSRCHYLAWDVPKLLGIRGIKSLLRLKKLLRQEKFSIVQTYFQDSTLFAGAAARASGVPVRIACFRDMGFWSGGRQDLGMRFIYRQMNGYIANAFVVRDSFAKRFGISPDNIEIIRNGVDPNRLSYVEQTNGVSDIGIVGNMTRHVKRTDLFIRAAGIVSRQHPGIRWHVIGDGPLRADLEVLAESVGLSERIKFAGRIDDVPGYLTKLQIGVISSDSEGLSNALIEYMFKGVAAVATAAGGSLELIQNGETGLLVPPGDAPALAAAMLRLIEDPGLRRRLATAARAAVQQAYGWERCIADHEKCYERLLIKGRG